MANMLIFFSLRKTHSFEKLSILRACEAQDWMQAVLRMMIG